MFVIAVSAKKDKRGLKYMGIMFAVLNVPVPGSQNNPFFSSEE